MGDKDKMGSRVWITVVLFLIPIILPFLLFACDSKSKPTELSQARVQLTFDSSRLAVDTIKLGKVREGEVITGRFAIINSLNNPLVITNIISGCGCTTTEFETKPIKGGEIRDVIFTFDSKGRKGTQIQRIDVIASDNRIRQVVLLLEVEGN